MVEDGSGFIDTTEAAKILGVNQSRIRQLIRSGELKAEQKTARGLPYWLLRRTDVEEFARIPRRPGPKPRGGQ